MLAVSGAYEAIQINGSLLLFIMLEGLAMTVRQNSTNAIKANLGLPPDFRHDDCMYYQHNN
jgi:hypothetical protein